MKKAFVSARIRQLPACTDWKGQEYPIRWHVAFFDEYGLCWPSGEYPTREAALLQAERLAETVNPKSE